MDESIYCRTYTLMDLTGYQIGECLYQGERTEVYRAQHIDTGDRAIVKILRTPHPSFKQLVQFRNQYAIARHLHHPGIVRPIALERYNNGYALIMPDEGAIPLLDYWQHSEQNLEQFFHIAIQLADALHYLNQQRIIHKDIKPANILIAPETGQVKLIDFSISSRLPKEIQTLQTPNILEGTLAYIPPEQTGRMNRGIDYRSDFYSLGVTFYQLLTDRLPFETRDVLELIHCHIAQHPLPPGNWLEQKGTPYPPMLSDLVLKLMAKNAEDRYQSALGLKYDLEKCLAQWRETQTIHPFVLGERDRSDRFIIPEQLYGRETEVENLLQAFERVSLGATEMMLVAGFSGIGKTAVVNEVHKPIVRKRGYFVKGKYDQFNRNIPFSAFVQAFRDLMEQLLTESDAKIQSWKTKLLAALGENAQVIIEVIPELEKIVGKQPQAIELSEATAQNRFNLLMHKFTKIFTDAEHPLVMFLDDLQWADSASLKLMQVLMSDSHHLLLIGAYRDNEVHPAHPLMLTLGEIQKAGSMLNTITLTPLSESHINRFVADTLKSTTEVIFPLSQLVFQKTKGNPFFATQFIKALQEENFIYFNGELCCWQCNLDRVKQAALTDDVVEFMALQLGKLSFATQEILKLAACIGNQFDLTTLAIVSEKSEIETATDLWEALQEGLILPQSEVYKFYFGEDTQAVPPEELETLTYKFLHDRVQQAAYSLIPDEQKQITHYRIGQLLLHDIAPERWESNIFNIINHLNKGIDLLKSPEQRNQLAELNLMAGKKALSVTAYATAARYFHTGIKFLEVDSWESQYRLTLSLYESAIEAEYLNINFAQAQTLADLVLERSTSVLERVKIYELQIQMYMAQSEMPKALAVGMLALELLGVDLNDAPTSSAIELPKLSGIESLSVMQDDRSIAILHVLMAIFAPAYTTQPELLSPIVLTMIDLSLKKGHRSLTAFAYVFYGILLCGVEKDIERGYYSGLLALKVLEWFSAKELECKVKNLFNVFIKPWKHSLSEVIKPLEMASQMGFETGDIEYASYAITHRCTYSFIAGETLTEVQEKQNIALEILKRVKQAHSLGHAQIWQQVVSNLLGNVADPKQLSGDYFDETKLLPVFCRGNDRSLPFTAYLAKCILSYLFEDYSAAAKWAVNAGNYGDAGIGITVAIHNFYHSLALLSVYQKKLQSNNRLPRKNPKNHKVFLIQVESNQKLLKNWAGYAPQNFEHKYSLVAAEYCQVLGKIVEASTLYDRAITLARENGYIQEQALANELAAKFYLKWGKTRIAEEYMTDAYYCYARWGAKAKVTDLEKRYPQLLAPVLQQTSCRLDSHASISDLEAMTYTISPTSSSSVSSALDFAAILKANQTLSSEIELDKLLSSLLFIIIENAGADKCALILLQDDRLLVQGSIAVGTDPVVLQQIPVEQSQELPRKLIYKVKHNLQLEVLSDISNEPTLARDPYIERHQPQSILCSPILHQSKLLGILYLENHLTKGAFTRERVELLNLLCAQAAISLENARLYERSQQMANSLQQALTDLQQTQLQLVQNEKMAALGNLVAGIAHEINNPLSFIGGNISAAHEYLQDLLEILTLYQENTSPPQSISKKIEDFEPDFIREDFPQLIASMQLGCDRIRTISTSLRSFSRTDTDRKTDFDLHEGIDSTLLILKYRLKATEKSSGIEIIKHYGDIPLVNCYPGQLNQVFMNLLANAIDALEESRNRKRFKEMNKEPNFIKISTDFNSEKQIAIVRIVDNAQGMPEEVKSRIFEQGFTTKRVGKGTGLGMAIAKSIVVEKHGGSIEVNSQVGQGTEFIISLPR